MGRTVGCRAVRAVLALLCVWSAARALADDIGVFSNERDAEAKRALAQVLGLAEVAALPAVAVEPSRQGGVEFVVSTGRHLVGLQLGPLNGAVSVVWRPIEGTTPLGLAPSLLEGQARRILSARFPSFQADSHLQGGSAPGARLGYLVWRDQVRPDVLTGDSAVVLLRTDLGEIAAYSEQRAVQRKSEADVRVRREEAERRAVDIVRERYPSSPVPSLRACVLVLSSPLQSEYGPVWQVMFQAEGNDGRAQGPTVTVVLDAMTAAEIAPRPPLQPRRTGRR